MALEGSKLPSRRYTVKLFTGAAVESDLNTWLATDSGQLVDFYFTHDGTNPVILALYCPNSWRRFPFLNPKLNTLD